MSLRSKTPRNRRLSTLRQRKQQHLLTVGVRAHKRNQQRNRLIIAWSCRLLVVASLVAAVVMGISAALRQFLWENPDYILAEVSVASDGSLTREQVLRTSGICEGDNIFRVDISKAREALAVLPQVATVEIQRILPNKIAVTISERKPAAWLTEKSGIDPSTSDRSFLTDCRGVLIKTNNLMPEYLHLPVISGVSTENMQQGDTIEAPEIKAAIELICKNAEGALQPRFEIQSVDLSKRYCMVATDTLGEKITFGFEQLDSQLERLEILLARIDGDKKQLRTVNLMVQRNVPVTFLPPIGESPAAEAIAQQTEPSPKRSSTPSQIASKPASKPAKKFAAKDAVKKKNADLFLKSRPAGTVTPVRKAIPVQP